MKKVIRYLFLICALFTLSQANQALKAMENSFEDSHDGCASKLSQKDPSIYFKKVDDGFYLVMERLAGENVSTWREFEKLQKDKTDEIMDKLSDEKERAINSVIKKYDNNITEDQLNDWSQMNNIKEKLPSEIFSQVQALEEACYKELRFLKDLDIGYMAFRDSLSYVDSSQVWIAYAYSFNDSKDAPYQPFDLSRKKHVELLVTVLTNPGCPISLHMGIARNAFHIAEKDTLPKHSNSSIFLQRFAAEIIKSRDPDKVYMMTKPASHMLAILEKNFSKNDYFLKETHLNPQSPYENYIDPVSEKYQLRIWNQNHKEIIFKATVAEIKTKFPFLEHRQLSQSMPRFMIDLETLARAEQGKFLTHKNK